jgi:RecB family exonuclease
MPFIEWPIDQKKLPEYTQTPLRKLRQCPLRYWYEYVKEVNSDSPKKRGKRDKQTIESTLGSLIHSTLKEFYKLPSESRELSDLIALFAKRWGKGYGSPDDREYWLGKAHDALQKAYELNAHLKPIKMETEGTRSTAFPFDNPRYRLKSTADRIDWYSDSEYCLVDYKWDERPLSEREAATDFQTVIYHITWTGDMGGVSPKLISYQYLSFGIQVDVVPSVSTMEPGIELLLQYIEKAEKTRSQIIEPEATRNEYCYNCKLYGKCPATMQVK